MLLALQYAMCLASAMSASQMRSSSSSRCLRNSGSSKHFINSLFSSCFCSSLLNIISSPVCKWTSCLVLAPWLAQTPKLLTLSKFSYRRGGLHKTSSFLTILVPFPYTRRKNTYVTLPLQKCKLINKSIDIV